MIGENFAFMSHVLELEKRVINGQLGEVRLIEARQINWMDRRNPYFNTSWRAQPEHSGGFVLDGGVHLAHVVRRCFGMPKVVGRNRAAFNPLLPPFDTALALLQFDSGAVGTWTSCFAARDSGPMLRVLGTRANASLFWDRLELTTPNGRTREIRSKRDSFVAQFEHFADVVLGGKASQMTPASGVLDLELICRVCG
jgi:predicted dehydrogenase